jgi:hypothetical protein
MNENEGQKQEQAEPKQPQGEAAQQQQQGAAPQQIEVIVTSSGEVTGQKQALSGLFSWWKYNYRRNEGKQDQVRDQVAILLHTMGVLTPPNIIHSLSTVYFDEHEGKELDALLDEVGAVEKALADVRKRMMGTQGTESTNGASSAG